MNDLNGFAEILHLLPDEEDYILIQLREFKFTRTGNLPKLYKVNTAKGKVKYVTQAPSYEARFSLSAGGEPLYSFGIDKDTVKNENKRVAHKYVDGGWQPLKEVNLPAEEIMIVAETAKPSEVIVRAEVSEGPDKLYRYNLDTGESEIIFSHPTVDPVWLDIDPNTNRLIAVHFEAAYPDPPY